MEELQKKSSEVRFGEWRNMSIRRTNRLLNMPAEVRKMKETLIYKMTWAATATSIALSLCSFFFSGVWRAEFSWLYFVTSGLWFFWIACTFLVKGNGWPLKTISLWAAINLIPLILFLSLALDQMNLAQSKGTDFVVLITYFPLLMPTGMLMQKAISGIDTASLLGEIGVRGALAVWLSCIFLILPQSLLIMGLSWLRRRSAKH